MSWKKLLETKDLIAYEKAKSNFKVRLEARNRKNDVWTIYKTYNFLEKDEWISHVREYVTKSREETKELLSDLRKERDVSLNDVTCSGELRLDLKRCYKEDFVEKWKFRINDTTTDNFLIVRYDSDIKIDIVIHDKFNSLEKDVTNKIIDALGLKDLSNRITYDFFYFKKRSARRRVFKRKEDQELVAKLEFNIDPKNM